MSKNSKELVMRDPSQAALLGVLPGAGDFGVEFDSYEFGSEFGDEFGTEFGDEIGAEEAALATPAGQSLVRKAKAAVAKANGRQNTRSLLMNPNAGLSLKVETYVMGLSSATPTQTFGTIGVVNFNDQPKVRFRPQRLAINVPAEGLVTISDISVSNVSVSVGNGPIDAFSFSPRAFGTGLDLPAIDPSQRASVLGAWSTLVPPGYVPGATFALTAAFIGPAHMAGK